MAFDLKSSDPLVQLLALLKDRFPNPHDPLCADHIEMWVEQKPAWFAGWIDPDATVHVLIKSIKFKGNFKRQTLMTVGAKEILARIEGAAGMSPKTEDPLHHLIETNHRVNASFSDWCERVLKLVVTPPNAPLKLTWQPDLPGPEDSQDEGEDSDHR